MNHAAGPSCTGRFRARDSRSLILRRCSGRFTASVIESFEDVADNAARWVSEHGVDVLRVETAEMMTTTPSTADGTTMRQVIGVRVWF